MHTGKTQSMRVSRITSQGFWLTDGQGVEVLMPGKYAPEGLGPSDELDVFVYRDNAGRLTATTLKAHAEVGEFASLTCKSVGRVGAFLDLGIEKDLLVPFREQKTVMKPGRNYVVFIYLDEETDRLVGSCRIRRRLESDCTALSEGQEVDLLAYGLTDLGVNVIIEHKYAGLLYATEVFRSVQPGDRLRGFVKHIRPDGRADVSLQREAYVQMDEDAERILQALKEADGFLGLTDKSAPGDIYDAFGISKKAFKRAVGGLYKQRLITLDDEGMRLAEAES